MCYEGVYESASSYLPYAIGCSIDRSYVNTEGDLEDLLMSVLL